MALTRFVLAAAIACSSSLLTFPPFAPAEDRAPETPAGPSDTAKKGLILDTPAACAGYTLFAPLNSTTTYLVDMKGAIAHSWKSRYEPGQSVYLLDDGALLRAAREPSNRNFGGGGLGGRVERLAPDGTVLWEFVYADENHCQHHDVEPLPNGNVLLIAWEKKTRAEAIAAGHDPDHLANAGLWPDCIVEVEPQGSSGGKIVWEWHVWDHLVQGFDKTKPNYGVVAEHPELVDLNYTRSIPRETPEELDRLRALGYVGGDEPEEGEPNAKQENDDGSRWGFPGGPGHFGGPDGGADWCHTNAVAYNAELDQIALSVHSFNEIWIIDHGITTSQAAGHAGGRYGRGGDLLYRWGNPRAYGAGQAKNQQFFAQHDVRWIPEGCPGAGHLMVFNNGMGRADGAYSTIVEIAPPIDPSGHYQIELGRAFGPEKPCWEYAAGNKAEFFASHISGAMRLPNGDTLICNGESGRIFEVTAEGKTVWDYISPFSEMRGPGSRPGGRRPFRFRDTGPNAADSQDTPQSRDAADSQDPPSREQRGDGPNARPQGRRRPPGGGPGGPPKFGPPGFGPPGFGPPGGPLGGGGGGVFRATRLALDHPGVKRVLVAAPPAESTKE